MTLHILWAHGARCLLVAQGFLGTTASGHDGSIFQLSPKSLGRVSGNICGVIKSSFLSSLKFPHKPQVCPDKEYHECIVNSSSNDLKIKCYLQQSGNRSKTQRYIFNKNWSYLGAHHKERATTALFPVTAFPQTDPLLVWTYRGSDPTEASVTNHGTRT